MKVLAKIVKCFQKKKCENCDYYFSKNSIIGGINGKQCCSINPLINYFTNSCNNWEWDGSWAGFKPIFNFILKWVILWTIMHEIMN